MWLLVIISLYFGAPQTYANTTPTSALPVLMLDEDNVMSRLTLDANPFGKVTSDFFTEIATDALKRAECVIIFVEDSLCNEDLSQRDSLGTPFVNLQLGIQDKKVVYMPSVSQPYHILVEIFEPHASNTFHMGSGEKLHLLDHHRHVFIYFQDDADLNRTVQLRKHDALMKDIYFTVRQMKGGPVVGFYTGKVNSVPALQLVSEPMVSVESDPERGTMVVTPDALFRLTGVIVTSHAVRRSFDQTPVVEEEVRTRRTLSTTMQFSDFHLQFNFEFNEQDWKLANVALLEAGEEVGRTRTDIEVPWFRSFYCSEPIIIFNMRDGGSITISEYQIEPFHVSRRSTEDVEGEDRSRLRGEDTAPTCAFSASINCGPYFNAPILSGLLIFALFFAITSWGVIMLLNCATNDRFDDPNLKPLIVATEPGGG